MPTLKSKSWAPLLAVAVAVFLATAVATQVAQAQEPRPPHDLSLHFRHGLIGVEGGTWIFVLTNQGGRHAHSGQVQVSFTPYRGGKVELNRGVDLDPAFGRFDRATGIWHFRNLRPGQTAELKLDVSITERTVSTGDGALVIGSAEIISSLPKEESMFLYNNATREAWMSEGHDYGVAEGNASLNMKVSDRFPEIDDNVDFTVEFRNIGGTWSSLYQNLDMYEVRVKVSPSTGLELKSAAAPSRTYDFGTPSTNDDIQISSSFDLSTGIWQLGSVPHTSKEPDIDMPVTVRYTGAVPLEEACLTAEVVNVVPPERTDHPSFQRDSRRRVCLGENPAVLIREVELPLLNIFPCVGETAYPCNDQDTVELVIPISPSVMRELGIDRSDSTVFRPEDMVLLVGDT